MTKTKAKQIIKRGDSVEFREARWEYWRHSFTIASRGCTERATYLLNAFPGNYRVIRVVSEGE